MWPCDLLNWSENSVDLGTRPQATSNRCYVKTCERVNDSSEEAGALFPNDTWQSCVTWSHLYHHYLHFLHQRLCLLPRPRHLVPRYRSLLCSLYFHLRTSKWSGFYGYLRIKISINKPFPSYPACASVSKRVLQQNLSSVNEFDFHESELPGETLFHMNGFVRGLV